MGLGESSVRGLVLVACSVLQVGKSHGVVNMVNTSGAEMVISVVLKNRLGDDTLAGRVSQVMAHEGLLSEALEVHTTQTGSSSSEAHVDDFLANTNSLEDLRALVAQESGNTHLGHHLAHTHVDSCDVVVHDGGIGNLLLRIDLLLLTQLEHGLEHNIRADSIAAKTNQRAHVVHLTGFSTLEDQPDLQTLLRRHQGLMDGSDSQQCLRRHTGWADGTVRQHDEFRTIRNRGCHLRAQAVKALFQALRALGFLKGGVDGDHLPVLPASHLRHALDAGQVIRTQDWVVQGDSLALLRRVVQQIALRTNTGLERHHDGFTERIDGRVCHLGEQLLEVVKHQARTLRHTSESCIVTHGAQRLLPVEDHWDKQLVQVLAGVVKHSQTGIEALSLDSRTGRDGGAWNLVPQSINGNEVVLHPLAVWSGTANVVLQILVLVEDTLLRVDQQHTTRLQASLLLDGVRRRLHNAHFARHNHHVVVGDVETGRSQTVTVQHCPNVTSIGEAEQTRAVPGLHQQGGPLVETLLLCRHQSVVLPGLRNASHHDFWQLTGLLHH
mmetsp:Transcript_6566/g.12307  ORF Transcript_6566/g.12307 Transcript_6566/m.12307 type:complete len:552 (-) Transcript_6566:949-2604(-)